MKIIGNIFIQSSAEHGGAIYIDTDNDDFMQIDENKFINCFSNHDGGVIYINKNNDNILIRNNTLVNCTSVEQGGGIMLSFSNKYLTIENNSFIDCKSNYGGAIYANYNISYVKILKNHFISCIALYSGGGIYFNIYNHDVIINDNNFDKGIVEKAGTAIMINSNNSFFMITECIITNSMNKKINKIPLLTDIGGVFYVGTYNSDITIAYCHFYNIKSNSYGAIVLYSENRNLFVISNQIKNIIWLPFSPIL
jgi:hypothetical protein